MSHPRLLYIDNIRILLICLVITTHTAITYGGSGSWYYTYPYTTLPATVILTLVTALNQTFFMGFFFLISAYFVPASLDRKGTRHYLHDRFIRLGIPLVVWVVLINPLLEYYVATEVHGYSGSFADFYHGLFVPFTGFGLSLMWFVFLLLVFTLGYIAVRSVRNVPDQPPAEPRSFPVLSSILLLGIVVGVLSFLVRIFFPIGYTSELFNIQFPFFPQYIIYFAIGLYAAQNSWLSNIPEDTGKRASRLALVLIVFEPLLLLFLFAVASGGSLDPVLGGLHVQALVYALWEQVTGIVIVVALLWLFSRRFDHQGPVERAASADTYAVYILHPLVLVVLSITLSVFILPPLLFFGIMLPMVIVLTFLFAQAIRAIPGVSSVL
jgi:fucose 4-O-acetylase-like acetyltransferase